MNAGDGQAAVPARGAGEAAARPAGLLEKLVAAVRPGFRADVLIFDPRDPVFGGPACAVPRCARPVRYRGMCRIHGHRWLAAGKPDLAEFSSAASTDWKGHRRPPSCEVPGCRYGQASHAMCQRHARQWNRARRPELATWQASGAPLPPPSPAPPTCRASDCDLWARGTSPLCAAHDARWKALGRPGPEELAACLADPGAGGEHIDLRSLPAQLRLEVQYVLQCRRDEAQARIIPARVQRIARHIAATGVTSMLDQDERFWEKFGPPPGRKGTGWRAFALEAFHRIETLAYGHGWDVEYPRDVWRLRNLGIDHRRATISFKKIPQPWLKDLAKRWARWQLTTGLGPGSVGDGTRALARFGAFLAAGPAPASGLAAVDRPLLERYLADLHAAMAGRACHGYHVGALGAFLRAARRHHFDDTLPPDAMLFPEDYPKPGKRLPRALAEHIMAQVEQPASLDRWDNPAYQLITLILIRCGLRITDAARVSFDCIVCDADGAPYLRYYNHKMKREALVPIDEQLRLQIGEQQQRVLQRWPGGVPVLFPRPSANLDGQLPVAGNTYRGALYRWLDRCDIRDEHGQPVHLKPHQYRHTLGTRMINRDVPQEVVRRLLDHDSAEMTAHYARLSDTTIRRHWEAARKVNAQGETVTLDPSGPLAEAAWARQRAGRATQALPNGFCGLPLVRKCEHANACLTCPLFVTTPEFLPQHREQHRQTLQIISAAEARGQARMAEMNRQVAANLQKIITALEAGDDPQEATADAP